ncbi:hypothetical protein BHE74_00017555 [Ensete ventricosum]|nr:hypothetical protein GW17_00030876 [Ensete ventricosum]RWW74495.1 hypothetical protein BHE74_00017555 [Ensete ventricosum]RZS01660.1 hypothetical protein BHM03_00031566 [Ensete ventricosum]
MRQEKNIRHIPAATAGELQHRDKVDRDAFRRKGLSGMETDGWNWKALIGTVNRKGRRRAVAEDEKSDITDGAIPR